MPKVRKFEQEIWDLFVEACGGGCNACGTLGIPLDRGHIQRHADDGDLNFDNLIPLCRSCNTSNKDSLTPDTRPVNWRDNFAKLFLRKLSVGLQLNLDWQVYKRSFESKPSDDSLQVIDNKGFIDLSQVKFVSCNVLLPVYTKQSTALTDSQAAELVKNAIRFAYKHSDNPIKVPPRSARTGTLIQLAKRNGIEIFTMASKEFLRRGNWPIDYYDPWAYFCDNFEMYWDYARDRKAELAEQKRLQELEQIRLKQEQEQKEIERAKRELPLLPLKTELRRKLDQCTAWDKGKKHWKRIRELFNWIYGESSLDNLKARAFEVYELHDNLNPEVVMSDEF